MTEHPHAALVRKGHEAANHGDYSVIVELLHHDIVWHNDVGAGPWSGIYKGRDDVLTMLIEFIDFFGGTFVQDIHDITASDEHTIALLREHGEVDGHRFENRAIYITHIKDDRVTELWSVDMDRDATTEFWRAAVPK